MEALSMTNARAAQTRKAGTPGPEGSVGQAGLRRGRTSAPTTLCMDLSWAPDAMLFPAGVSPWFAPDLGRHGSPDVRKMFLTGSGELH